MNGDTGDVGCEGAQVDEQYCNGEVGMCHSYAIIIFRMGMSL